MRRELCWWNAPQRAMRPHLVVVASPRADHDSCMFEGAEVVIVEAFISKLAIKAFDIRVLRRLAGSNEFEINAAGVSPSIQSSAGELRSLIGTNGTRQSSKLTARFQSPHHVTARDTVVDGDT